MSAVRSKQQLIRNGFAINALRSWLHSNLPTCIIGLLKCCDCSLHNITMNSVAQGKGVGETKACVFGNYTMYRFFLYTNELM